MEYVEYTFYLQTWRGRLSMEEFDRFALRAGYLLDDMTSRRIGKLWAAADQAEKDAISMACCAVIDHIAPLESTGGQRVSLEIVGDHHVSYFEPTKGEAASMRELVRPYLSGLSHEGEPLLYRGVGSRCRR